MTKPPTTRWRFRRPARLAGVVLLAAGAVATAGPPADKPAPLLPPAGRRVDFAKDVQPLLAAACHRCHGEKKQKGGYRLDRREDALHGGLIVPGRSADSPLVRYVSGADPDLRMPPSGEPLTAVQVDLLRAWIDQGARWGGAGTPSDAETHWAYCPLVKPPVPAVKNPGWVRNPVDSFILAKLEAKGLTPSPPADRRALLRRVTFDLTGLPPTPEEVEDFLADQSPDAYEKVVDRLLASPRYGERWARHWMDVAHYAETHGHDEDAPREHAWPYRDYLIRAFNDDKPYARFAEEQIAGDVLYPDDPQATVATGFLAAGPWDESSQMGIKDDTVDKQVARYLDRDDLVTTAMATFASTTVGCARCHDHKFDPISQAEYYGLQAVFAGVDRTDRPYDPDPRVARERRALLGEKKELDSGRDALRARLLSPAARDEAAAWEKRFAARRAARAVLGVASAAGAPPAAVAQILAVSPAQRNDAQKADLARFVLRQRVDARLAALPAPQAVYAVTTDFVPNGNFKPARGCRPVHLLRRGDVNLPGPAAVPGALACVPGPEPRFRLTDPNDEGARRAALAKWVSDPRNVLTWRSAVNRAWHYHFGRGLVATPGDFGRMGARPTHPELLDWLAVTFRDGGGSLKRLHRLLVTSAAYRQLSRHDPDAARRDADNLLLWRANRHRLDAEEVRDAVLAVSGKLDLTMGGPSAKQFVQKPGVHITPVVDYAAFDVDSPASYRRGVYRFVFRTLPDPFLETLDCPDGSQLTPVRPASVTALQALALLNDRFLVRQCEHFASRVARAGGLPDQVRAAYRLALGRPPTDAECTALAAYAGKHGMANACRLLLNCNEFLFVP